MRLSFRQSEFQEFRMSRRRWALRYRAGLTKKRFRPGKAGVGTLVHRGLEAMYGVGLGLDYEDPQEAIKGFWAVESLKCEERHLDEYRKQLKLALVMMEGYVEWVEESGIDAGIEVLGVERQLEIPFGEFFGHDVVVTGKADLEYLDAYGFPVLRDFKTRDGLTISPADEMDQQRKTYSVLKLMENPDQPYLKAEHVTLRRVMRTARAVPPFYGVHELVFTVEELRRHYDHLRALLTEMVPLAAGIEDGSIELDDPRLWPMPTRDCAWKCDFLDVCPLFDDGSSAWKPMLSELYEREGS